MLYRVEKLFKRELLDIKVDSTLLESNISEKKAHWKFEWIMTALHMRQQATGNHFQGLVTYKEFVQTLKQRHNFQFLPRVLPLKKVLATIKGQAVYHVSDINRDDFVMFRYELNNIFKRHFYQYRSPVRSRNLSPFHSTSGVLPTTSPSNKDMLKSNSAMGLENKYSSMAQRTLRENQNSPPRKDSKSTDSIPQAQTIIPKEAPPPSETQSLRPAFSLLDFGSKEKLEEIVKPPGIIRTYNLAGLEKTNLRNEIWTSSPLLHNKIIMRKKSERDKATLLLERTTNFSRAKLGARYSDNKSQKATLEKTQPSLKVEVHEPKVIEAKDYVEIVKDEREELKESFKEDLKRDREKRLLQRYSEEKVQARLGEWQEKFEKEKTKVKHYVRRDPPMLVRYEREQDLRKRKYFDEVLQSKLDAKAILERIMGERNQYHFSRYINRR